jgi:cation diffusion facilitator family transporter
VAEPLISQEERPALKVKAATLSIGSNSLLILLKVIAGSITGSVAILSEAMHSAVDLIASIVAYFSIRKADEPADEDHPWGHAKVENLAAAIEGMLILVGSGIIAFEAIRHLIIGSEVEKLGLGMAVIGFSMVVNIGISTYLHRRARQTESPALAADAAHLRTDAFTSAGVFVGLALTQITGATWIDPVVALCVAAAILWTGLSIITRSGRMLVDEALPSAELDAIREEIVSFGPRDVRGFHKLRARRAGSRRYVDLHVQFAEGTTLEAAHDTAHALQDAIALRLPGTDVLIHLEPEDKVLPGTEIAPPDTRPDAAETPS